MGDDEDYMRKNREVMSAQCVMALREWVDSSISSSETLNINESHGEIDEQLE